VVILKPLTFFIARGVIKLDKKGGRLMGKKKGQADKRSKSLRDKTSRLSDWKKKQRSNVKKFVQ
jgi:hypothetical protein